MSNNNQFDSPNKKEASRITRSGPPKRTAVLGFAPVHADRDPNRRVEQRAGDVPARALDPGDEVGPELGAPAARRPSPRFEPEEEPVSQARRAQVLSRAARRTAGRADLRPDRHRLRQAVAAGEGRRL